MNISPTGYAPYSYDPNLITSYKLTGSRAPPKNQNQPKKSYMNLNALSAV